MLVCSNAWKAAATRRKGKSVNSQSGHSAGIKATIAVCAALLAPCTLFFLVNVELALRIYLPALRVMENLLPTGLYRVGAALSVDLSTVSTAVPVLILLFPLVQAVRLARGRFRLPAVGSEWMPYPAHFPYFLIMLGLFGTLYGLLIGLQESGVEGFVSYRPEADSISQSLTRLLAGTATAIWSSLIGLAGAFVAAQPLPMLFRRMVGIERPPEAVSLADTVQSLAADLAKLGEVSRELGKVFSPEVARAVFAQLDAIGNGLKALAGAVEKTNSELALFREERRLGLDILKQQTAQLVEISGKASQLDAIRASGHETLNVLQASRTGLLKIDEKISGLEAHCSSAAAAARASADALSGIAAGLPAQAASVQKAIGEVADNIRENLRELREERESFRRSLAAYVGSGEDEKRAEGV